jgi:hypothetical protein
MNISVQGIKTCTRSRISRFLSSNSISDGKMATEVHKYGTDDGWHGIIKEGGEFPPEKDRYHLYIGRSIILLHSMSSAL